MVRLISKKFELFITAHTLPKDGTVVLEGWLEGFLRVLRVTNIDCPARVGGWGGWTDGQTDRRSQSISPPYNWCSLWQPGIPTRSNAVLPNHDHRSLRIYETFYPSLINIFILLPVTLAPPGLRLSWGQVLLSVVIAWMGGWAARSFPCSPPDWRIFSGFVSGIIKDRCYLRVVGRALDPTLPRILVINT